MNPTAARSVNLLAALALVAGSLLSHGVSAQYKWTNADGSVSYGDRPPSEPAKMLSTPKGAVKEPVAAPEGSLPYPVRQAATRYPVVLYTGNVGNGECQPCKEGREYLSKRGIPFSEKLVKSAEDVSAFKAGISPDGSMPVLMVGKEKSVGFETGAWSNLLDSAGYPKNSMLPPGYRHAAAESLTRTPAADTAKPAPARKEEPSRSARGAAPTPAGMVDANADAKIRF